MLHTDIEMELPKHRIRIRKQGKNNYVYYLLGRKGDSRGNERDVSVCVGRVSREGFFHPNDAYYARVDPSARKMASPSLALPAKDDQSRVGALLALRHIAESNGTTECLKLAFPDRWDLILSLACYYLLCRDSAAQLFSDFSFDHYLDPGPIASEATISRLFNQRITEGGIDTFRSAFLRRRIREAGRGRKTVLVDLDSSNVNCSSPGLEMAERGHPKDDEGLPQVNFAYFYERGSGVPIFYDAFYGSVTDVSQCLIGMELFLANLGVEKRSLTYQFVLDRGYFSSKNLDAMDDSGIRFSAMGRENTALWEHVESHGAEARSPERMIEPGVYGTRLRGRAFPKGRDYFIYLFHDSAAEAAGRSGIEASIARAKKALEGKRVDRGGNLKRTYGNILDIEETRTGRIRSVRLKSEELAVDLSRCGFFWIVSNVEMEPEAMLRAYRQRDEIEKGFRAIKSDSDMNKTFARTDAALRAKVFIGYITAILRSDLTRRTRDYVSRHPGMTTQKILLAMDKAIIRKTPAGYLLKYALTAQQQEIMKAIGMEKKLIDKTIRDINAPQKGRVVV